MTIHLELREDIAWATLDHGLDIETCTRLVLALEEADAAGARALVLTGTGDTFSPGIDATRLAEGGARYVEEFLPALSDALLAVFGFPHPVVAAVNGHATGSGLVLAAACDHRVAADGAGRMGVPQLLAGAPFPLAALEILRCAYGTGPLPALAYSGAGLTVEDALARGLVDEVVPAGELPARAGEMAVRLAGVPAEAFAHTKAQLRQPYHERIAENRVADDAQVQRLWSAESTLAAVKSSVDVS
ncbi:enoyl-CoA hydratase/isomerase family protein [Amycolatopsis jiangsuensis]|uniref:Enoyl-CoA hydratase n=1 Tax=Amycolatopsis jiangsuensis TaxID=1181879 RepID=A0A840IPG0_9PSEU|nr:enoyl-CoA hydratase/isomerase family protein [Amycolatopsis jiangsuensis]MBB4682944.1 enoyl-CoA hydratase [Amycolatopsis jiangsuensis]